MTDKHVPPTRGGDAFDCPHCGAFAQQYWPSLYESGGGPGYTIIDEASRSICIRCRKSSWWVDEKMIYPLAALGPQPHEDMPKDVRDDYEEARSIAGRSPRGACALLRLGLQKLCIVLGQPGKNLNTDIGNLVKEKGLLPVIQQSLDALRVIGNNAVHPGALDLSDDQETVVALLNTMNVIVEQLIAAPKHAEELYAQVPQTQKEAITKRENT